MINIEDIKEGLYWAKWIKDGSRLFVTVYGQPPFLRADLWEPGFGMKGLHIENVDITKKPIEFIEEIKGLK